MSATPSLPLLAGLLQPGADRSDAVRVAGERSSFEELLAAAGALAARIAGAGSVAVWAQPTMATVVGVVGGLLAGVPVVPIAPDSGPLERQHVLRDSGAALLLGDPGAVTELETVAVDLRGRSDRTFPEPPGGAPALILYTSGTTGPPKGVVISRRAIAADLDALADAWAWTPDDVLVHGLPLFHVHGLVLGVLGALRMGCGLVHTGRPTPSGYAAAAGSLYFGVPTVWSRVCADPAAASALRPARLLVSGSAALPAPVFERLSELTGHRPVERYGMTETLITLSARADGERHPGCVGFPLAGITTRLAPEEQDRESEGEVMGELLVKGPTLFDGYLGNDEATAGAFAEEGWFRTGDMAIIGADGAHRIVGRRSTDLIKTGGYRVGAGEVENALLAHPGVREAAVVGVPDDDLGQAIRAFVVAEGVSGSQLQAFVAEVLAVHKRPRSVEFVAELPKNAMGKVQKAALSRRQGDRSP